MSLIYSFNTERKILIDEMKKLKYNCKKKKWSIMHIIKYIGNELIYKKLIVCNLSYFNIFFLLIIFSLKYIVLIKIILYILIFLYLKYLIHYLLLFLYNCNIHKFNEVIKLLYKYEYAKIVNGNNKNINIIIDDLYCSIYKITRSILCVYFFFMKNVFFYLFECNNTEEINNSYCSTNLISLCYLKDFYFHLYIVLFDLKIKRNYSEKEEKRNLYKNIRDIFKEKYKDEYEMMKVSENSLFIFYVYQFFHDIIKYMFYFLHFFIFIPISIFYLLKSYFLLSSYKNILKKKNNLLLIENEETKLNNVKRKNEIVSLLIDSLTLLKSFKNDEYDDKIYNLIENKLYNAMHLIRSVKKGTTKIETKSLIINNNADKKIDEEDKKKKNFNNYLPYEEKNVFETNSKLIENNIIEKNEENINLTYDIYYYNNKECGNYKEKINNKENKNNYKTLNSFNNRKIGEKETNQINELKTDINPNSYIYKYNYNTNEIKYKTDDRINLYDKDISTELCIDNMLNELRIRFKKKKNYKYVKKKLCYNSSENDFCIKNCSLNDIQLLNEYDNCPEETRELMEIAKITDENNCTQDIISDKITIKKNYLNNEEDQKNDEIEHLKPIENISSFREKIALSILQRNLTEK